MMILPPKEILDANRMCKPWEIYDKVQEKIVVHPDAPEVVKIADKKRMKWLLENYPDNY